MPPKDPFISKCGLVRGPYFRNALTPRPYFHTKCGTLIAIAQMGPMANETKIWVEMQPKNSIFLESGDFSNFRKSKMKWFGEVLKLIEVSERGEKIKEKIAKLLFLVFECVAKDIEE